MKLHITNYLFNATNGTVTFNDYVQNGISLNNILLIVNATVGNTIIYNFAVSGFGGTVNGNVLTLSYNTSAASMNNTDSLIIYYDDSNVLAKDTSIQLLENQNDLLRRMVKLLESQGTVDSSNRQRVTIDAPLSYAGGIVSVGGPILATAQSVTAANNPYVAGTSAVYPVNIFEGPVTQLWRVADSARTTFGTSIRPNIK